MDRSKRVASMLLATSLAGTAGANVSTGIKLTNFLNGATTVLTTAAKPFVAVAIFSVSALGLVGYNLYGAAKWGKNKLFGKKAEEPKKEPKDASNKNIEKEALPSKFSNFKDRIKKALENMDSVMVNTYHSSISLAHLKNNNNNFIKITKLKSENIEVRLNYKCFKANNICDIEKALNDFFEYSKIDLRVKPIEKENPSLDDIKIVDKKDYDNIYHVKIGDLIDKKVEDKDSAAELTEEEKNAVYALIKCAEKEIKEKEERKRNFLQSSSNSLKNNKTEEEKKKIREQKEFNKKQEKETEEILEKALELDRKNEKKLFRGKAEKFFNGAKNFLVNTAPKAILSFLRSSEKLKDVNSNKKRVKEKTKNSPKVSAQEWENFKKQLKYKLENEGSITLYVDKDSVSLNINHFNFIEIKKTSSGTVNVRIGQDGISHVMKDFCDIEKELNEFFTRHDIDFRVAPIEKAKPSLDDIKIVEKSHFYSDCNVKIGGDQLKENSEKNNLEPTKNNEDDILLSITNSKEGEKEIIKNYTKKSDKIRIDEFEGIRNEEGNNKAEINHSERKEKIKEKEQDEKKSFKNIGSSYEDIVSLNRKTSKDVIDSIFEKTLENIWQPWKNFKKYLQNTLVKDCCYVSSPWKDTITLGKGEVNLSITYLGENKFKVSSHYVPKGYEGVFDAKGVAKSLEKFFERGYSKYYRLDNSKEVNSLEDIKIIDVVKENEDAKLKDSFFGITEEQWENFYKFLAEKFKNSGTEVGISGNLIMLTKGYETAFFERLDSGKIKITSRKEIFEFNTFSSFQKYLNSIFKIFGLDFRIENKEELKQFVSLEVPADEKVNDNSLLVDDEKEEIVEDNITDEDKAKIDDKKSEENEENSDNKETGCFISESFNDDEEDDGEEDDDE